MVPTTGDELKRALEVLRILKQELPQAFKDTQAKTPLKAGVDIDLFKRYKKDDRFTTEELHQALYLYTNGKHYLNALIEGTPRINLDGKKVGKVTAGDAAYAKELIQRHHKRKYAPRPAEYGVDFDPDEELAEESDEDDVGNED